VYRSRIFQPIHPKFTIQQKIKRKTRSNFKLEPTLYSLSLWISIPGGAPNATKKVKRQSIITARSERQTKRRTILDRSVNEELSSDKTGGHDHPWAETCPNPDGPRLAREGDESMCHGARWAVPLVDLDGGVSIQEAGRGGGRTWLRRVSAGYAGGSGVV
jgi:hypothetical protein